MLVKKRGRRIVKILRPLPVGRYRFLFNFKTVLKSTTLLSRAFFRGGKPRGRIVLAGKDVFYVK